VVCVADDEALRQLLAETDALLAESQLELRRLEEHVRALEAERYGLQLALARRREEGRATGGAVAPSAAAAPRAALVHEAEAPVRASWQDLPRSDAVLEVLVADGGPMTRGDIAERLAATGRLGDHADAVSATLAYLRRAGRVERVGSGLWAATSGPLSA
jgi:hypothetical protein